MGVCSWLGGGFRESIDVDVDEAEGSRGGLDWTFGALRPLSSRQLRRVGLPLLGSPAGKSVIGT